MKQNHLICLLMSSFAAANGFAETLADPDEIQPVKTFSPPKPIAPTAAQGYFPENQFDRTDRSDHYFVTENIDQAFRPLKANSGFYGKSFYNSVTAQARGAKVYGVVNLNHTKANGYKDGDSNQTDWKYSRFNQVLYSVSCRLKIRNTASPTYTTTSTTTANRSSSTTHWIPNATSPNSTRVGAMLI